ncbi:MAG: aldo/keto reductase [Parvibaculum sp.]|uniref:aldo/keto reductase n=1 Tax=Parvibaculum sp. TaxID=2024848 RepID=UPI00271EFD25|nr:aldo/keto reductase [Parvibaculum sp.]MDO8837674.1 aldo/keto reductase [Parvibaculum sp.]
MEMRQLGKLWPVSALTLGGGGLGQIWGATTRDEAVATVRAAADAGITLFDMAPSYGRGEAEAVMGAAFDGHWPEGLRVTTKCMIGGRHFPDVAARLEASLVRSLATMKRQRIDIFFLHSNICPDGYVYGRDPDFAHHAAVTLSAFTDIVVPAFEKLKKKGLIGAWGITGTGLPRTIMEVLRSGPRPAVVQAVTNLLDSPGGMRFYEEPAEPRNIIRTAQNNDVGVMGIRAVQAGALTLAIDRKMDDNEPEMRDYARAEPFRALCREIGEDPAIVAHRYALAIPGVDTLVLGVKNRAELASIVDAAAQGPIEADLVGRIDALRLNFQIPRMPIDGEDML